MKTPDAVLPKTTSFWGYITSPFRSADPVSDSMLAEGESVDVNSDNNTTGGHD